MQEEYEQDTGDEYAPMGTTSLTTNTVGKSNNNDSSGISL